MAMLKPTAPLLASDKGPLKPASPLHRQNAPKTPISRPQRRWRFQSHTDTSEQRRQGFQTTGPPRLRHPDATPAGDDDTTSSQISHAIRLEEVSTISENGAIPTLLIHDSKESRGNCMRNWGSSAATARDQAGHGHAHQNHAAGEEGAGGICHGAGGRWRGLAGLRDDAPRHRRCGGRRRDRRARAGFEARRRTK